MRKAPIVLTTTAVGVAGVLAFQPREPDLPALAAATAASGSGASWSSSGSSSSGSKTATGDAIDTQYGPAQVRVTIKDGKIVDVEALQLQRNDPKSAQISSYAAPLLRESALTKQSGDIDTVSGATFTSASYEASLQSALDRAGFEAADGSRGSTDEQGSAGGGEVTPGAGVPGEGSSLRAPLAPGVSPRRSARAA